MYQKTEDEIRRNWEGDIEKTLVSVCCITFNHESYINEAIDGILNQKTNFPFEIIIRDDCSTDRTVAIIKRYVDRYPKLIKPIFEQENQFSKGVKPLPSIYKRATGEYIALCEGDDYWTGSLKLQKQIDFLKQNPEYTGFGHQAVIVDGSNAIKRDYYRENISSVLDKNDFLQECPFQTATFVFQSKIVKRYPLDKIDYLSGDKALMLLISRFGLIKYCDQPMSCYRQHEGGLSSRVTVDLMRNDLNIIPWIKKIDPNFPKYLYTSYIHQTIMFFSIDCNIHVLLKHYFYSVAYSFSFFPKNIIYIGVMTKNVILRLGSALIKTKKNDA